MVASGSRARTWTAARPMHGAVFRGQGSARIAPRGNWDNCSWTAPARVLVVAIRIRSSGTRLPRRSAVAWSMVRSPWTLRNCFGRSVRLAGQSRVPEPPARMTAWSMGK